MTHEERVKRVAEAINDADHGIFSSHEERINRRAEAAITASDATIEVTDDMVETFLHATVLSDRAVGEMKKDQDDLGYMDLATLTFNGIRKCIKAVLSAKRGAA